MAQKFAPTHIITTKTESLHVMLDEGRAYTASEWDAGESADWTYDADDGLLCLGEVVDGSEIRKFEAVTPYLDGAKAEKVARGVGGVVASRTGKNGRTEYVVIGACRASDRNPHVWGKGDVSGYVDSYDVREWEACRADALPVLS